MRNKEHCDGVEYKIHVNQPETYTKKESGDSLQILRFENIPLLHSFLDLDHKETTRKNSEKLFDQPAITGLQTARERMKSISQ